MSDLSAPPSEPVEGGEEREPTELEIALLEIQQKKLEHLRAKVALQEGLPFLPDHGFKLYQWSQEYWDARDKIQLVCAANQISKSSSQIRKHIHWATEQSLWPELWPTSPRPLQFWYLYPTRDVAHIEFEKKWKPEFLPRGEYKDDPKYGWRQELYHNRIFAIHWNSGVSTYFKTYGQDAQDLQTGTVWKLDLDEETPEELMDELMFRLAATDGYLSAVFTPTIGQQYWKEAIEGKGASERFKGAFKRQVSMYDCLQYADGSKSPWTIQKIIRATNACRDQKEVQRRVFGKFVVDSGLKYGSFSRERNVKTPHPLPKTWHIYIGVDTGSGGKTNHPGSIVVVAVSPDFKMGRVIRGWRGDKAELPVGELENADAPPPSEHGAETTAGDIVKKLVWMLDQVKGFASYTIYYDFADRDFYLIATGAGLVVQPAEKSHFIGETTLNTLFKNEMLIIYEVDELEGLPDELESLKKSTSKQNAVDDYIDGTRYAVAKVPWDYSGIRDDKIIDPMHIKKKNDPVDELRARREQVMQGLVENDNLSGIEREMAEFNALASGWYDS